MRHVVRPRTRAAPLLLFFFFNDTATTEIYTLSLHDALPIYVARVVDVVEEERPLGAGLEHLPGVRRRSEEHTSELQSLAYLVCRLLLENKNLLINTATSFWGDSRRIHALLLTSLGPTCLPAV